MTDLLRVKIRGRTPPGKWRFVFKEDGHRVESFAYEPWLEEIKRHYTRNGYAMPEDWAEQAENQCCKMLPPGECMYGDGSPPQHLIDARFSLDDVINGTKVLTAFVMQGMPLVEQSLAESRGKTCAACYAAVHIPGCTTCSNMVGIAMEVAGARATAADQFLVGKACAVCKCAAQAHIWVPIDILEKGMTAEMEPLWPADFCWKIRERNELRAARAG